MAQTVVVNCPTCNQLVEWSHQNAYRPFCCKHCQLADLDAWETEKRAVAGDDVIDNDDSDTSEPY